MGEKKTLVGQRRAEALQKKARGGTVASRAERGGEGSERKMRRGKDISTKEGKEREMEKTSQKKGDVLMRPIREHRGIKKKRNTSWWENEVSVLYNG